MRTQRECLAKRTAGELGSILMQLGCYDPDLKRATMIDKIVQGFEGEIGRIRLHVILGPDGVKTIRPLFRKDEDPGQVSITMYNWMDTLGDILDRLAEFGLSYRDRKGWHVLPQVYDAIRRIKAEEREQMQAREAAIERVTGCLLLYGMLTEEKAAELAEVDYQPGQLIELMLLACGTYTIFPDLEEDEIYLTCGDVDDPSVLLRLLRAPGMAGRPLAVFDHDRIMEASLLETGVGLDSLMAALKTLGEGAAPFYIKLLMADVENDDAPLDTLADRVAAAAPEYMPAVAWTPACTAVIRDMVMNMPLWRLKGRTLTEYKRQSTVVSGPKIGRNDPCPCGSGRKYKNCCGRFQ